jgi:uncharacterized protein (TIGR02147 family)
MSESTKSLPNLFEYDNYRKFLVDFYEAQKAQDKKFSFRYFARIAGFSSHNFLRQVMRGESNLSPDSIEKMATALKFNPEKAHFFKNLVLLNQATTSEQRHLYAKEILRSQTYKRIHPLGESQYQFFAHWYVSAVRELVALAGFKENPQWIAERVTPPIKPQEAKRAIEDLLNLGLLKRDQKGKLIQSDALLSTPAEVSSAFVANWHKQYMARAVESIDTFPREKRDISAVSFGFSKKNIKVIKEMIANFRREILEVASQQENKDILMQFNMQIFPLAEIDSEEST